MRAIVRAAYPCRREDPADARAVAAPERDELVGRAALHRVRDDERRVVLDPGARAAARGRRSRSPRPTTRAIPSRARAARRRLRRARRAHGGGRRCARSPVPEVSRREHGRVSLGHDGRPAEPSLAAARPREAIEPVRRPRTAPRHARGDPAGRRSRRRGTPTRSALELRTAQRSCARERPRVERRWSASSSGCAASSAGDAVVGVLVDDDEPEGAVRLRLERVEQRSEGVGAVDRRDDEVEAEISSGFRHRRRLPSRRPWLTPLVSVVLAARDAEATDRGGRRERPRADDRDLELVVVDDGSVDAHGRTCSARSTTRRLRVVRNQEPLGLAGALNVGLDAARGSYVARMDADDVALPRLARAARRPHPVELRRAAVVGTGMIDLQPTAARRRCTGCPSARAAVRWAALFSSPFFHSTVLVDRAVLDRHGLRYDTSFEESEDYDLWTRLLSVAEGDNIPEPLVFYRKHPGQASARRAALQRECQRRVAAGTDRAALPSDARRASRAGLAGGCASLAARRVRSRRCGGARPARRRVRAELRRRRGPSCRRPCARDGAWERPRCARAGRAQARPRAATPRDRAGPQPARAIASSARWPSGGCGAGRARRRSRSRWCFPSRRPIAARCSNVWPTGPRST